MQLKSPGTCVCYFSKVLPRVLKNACTLIFQFVNYLLPTMYSVVYYENDRVV